MSDTLLTQNGDQYGRLKGTAAGQTPLFDGTNWTLGTGGGGSVSGAFAYDLRNSYTGTPPSNAVIDYFVASTAFVIDATSTAHKFRAVAAPGSGAVTLNITRNGTIVFSVTYDVGSTTGTVSAVDTAQNSVAVGDVLRVETSGAVDADFSRPYWNINAYTLNAFTYDLHGAFKGQPSASSVLDYFIASRAFNISQVVADLLVSCGAKPSATSTTIYFKKNGTTAITATFTTGDSLSNGLYASTNVVVVSSAACAVALGDVVTVETDATVDGDFSTIVWALKGTP